ncbi:MAG: MoaD/ThiS family protein [Halobacteriota archaeon]|nr:MoaD/ThiS family protein [Halobacteriota archaeon]
MKVSVEIHGFLEHRTINLKRDFRIKEGGTVKDALVKIGKKIKIDLPLLLTKVSPVVMVNNERLDLPEGFTRTLYDGDLMVILQPLAGG